MGAVQSYDSAAEAERRFAALLDLALTTPPEERRAALEAAEPDRSLVDAALGLIETDDPEFLSGPALHRVASLGLDPSADSGPDVPGYTVLGLLGRGGMGEVYLASDDASPDRRVAIKRMRHSLDPELARRFAVERDALARLDHRAIARLFASGTSSDGYPYVVMEVVEGRPITRHCDEERLSIEERLRLFVDVCRGVEHAHRRGLLHRDLKPSNILVATVDGEATPKVIDFGIARDLDASEASDATRTGSTPGTPAYMSPEALAAGAGGQRDLDTRTDVYSLGVVLYELLVGGRPHAGLPDDPLLPSRILRDEPPMPSARWRGLDAESRASAAEARRLPDREGSARLSGDLDWIVMKAIERDRDRRYGSVAELAADVERHLRLEPIEARPPTLRYRADRFVRRHRLPVAAALVALVALLVGAAGATVGMVRARVEARRAAEARDEAEAVAGFLQRIFETSSPYALDADRAPSEVTAREILDEGAKRVGDELAAQPAQAARVRATLGAVYRGLALADEARAQLSAALDDLDRAEAMGAAPALRSAIELELARVAEEQNRFEQALVHLDRSEALARERLEEPRRTRELTRSLSVRAQVYEHQARFDLAESALREALEMLLAASEMDLEQLYDVRGTLGHVYFAQERWAEAEEQNRAALRLARDLFPSGHFRIARRLESLGAAIASQGRFEEAAPFFAEAFETKRAVLPENHPALAASLHNLGSLALDRGRFEEALDHHRQALAIRLEAFGEESPFTAASREGLARALTGLGRLDEAREEHEKALAARRAALGAAHPRIARNLELLGDLARTRSDRDEAEARYREALAVRRAGVRGVDPRRADAVLDLVEVLLEGGAADEIPALLEEAEVHLPEEDGDEAGELRERLASLRGRLATRG